MNTLNIFTVSLPIMRNAAAGIEPSMSELQRANMFEAESPTAERIGAGPPK